MSQTSSNNFDPLNPWTHRYLPSTYPLSNFKKIEEKVSLYPIDETLIKLGLNDQECQTWDSIDNNLYPTIEEKAVHYWTLNEYKNIQTAIRDDNISQLIKYMPIIIAIKSYITKHRMVTPDAPHSDSIITYRKSKISGNQIDGFKNMEYGKVVRSGLFTATTKNSDLLVAWEGKTIIKYIINNGCKNACNISNLSQFPYEQEVLLPPYTPVKFVSFKSFTLPSDIGKNVKDLTNDEINQLKTCPFIILKVLDHDTVCKHEKWNMLFRRHTKSKFYAKRIPSKIVIRLRLSPGSHLSGEDDSSTATGVVRVDNVNMNGSSKKPLRSLFANRYHNLIKRNNNNSKNDGKLSAKSLKPQEKLRKSVDDENITNLCNIHVPVHFVIFGCQYDIIKYHHNIGVPVMVLMDSKDG